MDIQGAEFLALQGMEQTIRNNQNLIIFMEFYPQFIRKCGLSASDILACFSKYKFHWWLIDEDHENICLMEDKGMYDLYDSKSFHNLILSRSKEHVALIK